MSGYITQADLEWWLKLAPTLTFKNASTYEKTAPHNYVVRDRHLGSADFDRACRVIHTYGELQMFHARMNAYLVDRKRNLKWWTMGMGTTGHGVINQGQADIFYGKQTAPKFETEKHVLGDSLSSFYDENSFVKADESAYLRNAAREVFGAYAPTLLDIGAGTGQVLDSGITSPLLTTVVEPSRGMLNHLVLKHPKVKNIESKNFMQVDAGKHEMVTAMGGTASLLSTQEIVKAHKASTSLAMFSVFKDLPEWAGEYGEMHEKAKMYLKQQAERLDAGILSTDLTTIYIFKRA